MPLLTIPTPALSGALLARQTAPGDSTVKVDASGRGRMVTGRIMAVPRSSGWQAGCNGGPSQGVATGGASVPPVLRFPCGIPHHVLEGFQQVDGRLLRLGVAARFNGAKLIQSLRSFRSVAINSSTSMSHSLTSP